MMTMIGAMESKLSTRKSGILESLEKMLLEEKIFMTNAVNKPAAIATNMPLAETRLASMMKFPSSKEAPDIARKDAAPMKPA